MKIFIETERLILRELLPSDARGMFALDSNPNVLQHIGIQPITTMDECRKIIRIVRDQYEKNGIGRWAVTLKDSYEFIGWAGLKLVNEQTINNHQNYYDLGYRFIERYWEQGYGYEATQAIINYGFKTLKIDKIHAYVTPDNLGSKRILEKCGLNYIETFEDDGELFDWMEIRNKKDYQ